MPRQQEVIKADGAVEQYLHTKVLATLNHAFGRVDRSDLFLAQELADVVTYYLYHNETHPGKSKVPRARVPTNEILSMIKGILTTTGHEDAAASLIDYHYARQLKRNRIDVVHMDLHDLADAQRLCDNETGPRAKWSKSRITQDLMIEYSVPRQTARAIASMVEEKILGMDLPLVPTGLIRMLMLNDTALVLRAQEQLHAPSG